MLSPLHWLQFLKDQATLSAEELTAESVKDFVSEFSESDLEFLDDEYEADRRLASEILGSSSNHTASRAVLNGVTRVAYVSSNGSGPGKKEAGEFVNGAASNGAAAVNGAAASNGAAAAVNGKHSSRVIDEIFGKKGGGGYTNGSARSSALTTTASLRMTIEEEARAKFEAWQIGRVAMWHGTGDHSLQWLSICCVDRKRRNSFVS